MKKRLWPLWMITATILASCGQQNDKKVPLIYGDENITTYVTVTDNDIVSKIENKENFFFFIYLNGCGCWTTFRDQVLVPYIQETHIYAYGIEVNSVKGTVGYDIFYNLPVNSSKSNTPVMGLYQDGELQYSLAYTEKNKTVFESLPAFENWMNKYSERPTMFFVNLNMLNQMLESSRKFVLYYSRKSCPDCTYIERNFLKNYGKTHLTAEKLYILDCDVEGIRYTNGQLDENQFNAFKAKYGMSDTYNPLGYAQGFVPTFQYIEADGTSVLQQSSITSVVTDQIVTLNDTAVLDGNTVVIDRTYFDGSRNHGYPTPNLANQVLLETEYAYVSTSDSYRYLREAQAKHTDPILQSFLDLYLQKSN